MAPKQTDVVAWEIDRKGVRAVICEDGSIESVDPELERYLQERLREPVVIFRRGTIAGHDPESSGAIELHPGDGRYVVARVRSLAAEDASMQILGIVWNDEG